MVWPRCLPRTASMNPSAGRVRIPGISRFNTTEALRRYGSKKSRSFVSGVHVFALRHGVGLREDPVQGRARIPGISRFNTTEALRRYGSKKSRSFVSGVHVFALRHGVGLREDPVQGR